MQLVKDIRKGRNIKREQLVLSADKGCGKVIVTLAIFDADSNGKIHSLKPGSNQRIFLLAMVNYSFLKIDSHLFFILRWMTYLSLPTT